MSHRLPTTDILAPFEPDPAIGWNRRDAVHLLRRTQSGASQEEVEQAVADGLPKTLDRLLAPPSAEAAEFQATDALLRRVALDTRNINDLKVWWLHRMLRSADPLAETMALFWHNHFATSNAKVRSVEQMAAQNDLIRRHSRGSFRELLHGMTRDVAMLVWLDGNANRKRHANENFARELMELFTLGVGNYTEQDIQEAARAFSGWHVRNGEFWFNRLQHDDGTKQVLGSSGNLDGDDVVELCLAQPACPRFLAGKLLRAFVLSEPDQPMIDALAERIRTHNFVMTPVLRELFGSQLFFSPEARHALIKSPVQLVLGAARPLGGRPNLEAMAGLTAELGQDLFQPPTVKGWEGGRLWISSATFLRRASFAAEFATGSRFGSIDDLAILAERQQWQHPDEPVRYFVELLLARDLEPALIEELTRGFQRAEGSLSERLRGLVHLIMTMPEYQLT